MQKYGLATILFLLLSVSIAEARTKMTGDVTIWINCSTSPINSVTFGTYGGGSDSNPGTLAQPYLTTQAAVNFAWGEYDTQGHQVTFQHSPATCSKGVITNAFMLGQACCMHDDMIRFLGDPTAYTVFATSSYPGPFLASDSASIYIENMIISCSFPSCNGFETNWQGKIFQRRNIFGNVSNAHMQSITKGHIESWGDYIVGGNAVAHMTAGSSGMVQAGPVSVTVTGNPTINVFATAGVQSTIFSNAKYIGTSIGKKFDAAILSLVYNSTATPFPGNVAGTVATGAVYIGP